MKRCIICLHNDIDTIFVPCGHFTCCRQCARKIEKCAICRVLIRKTYLVFFAV
ncbi:hypothetical protein HELRODRAFT_70966 [Helobdella robusta]|uniref:RING-type domain-containing protein n=1 Tax=Helobdella robusta TaxID=6412 RepID=T1G0F0_HELRO|nr:hypothetical protein HELRODRAFT_70966 [Helobdella robusta]ESN90748.1 hypothetical protein HELRODRAFT_70966 [Helobdella robusta]